MKGLRDGKKERGRQRAVWGRIVTRSAWRGPHNWMNQKRKKQSIPPLVMLADSGRWFGNVRNEGAKAMRIWRIDSEPARATQEKKG